MIGLFLMWLQKRIINKIIFTKIKIKYYGKYELL